MYSLICDHFLHVTVRLVYFILFRSASPPSTVLWAFHTIQPSSPVYMDLLSKTCRPTDSMMTGDFVAESYYCELSVIELS